MDYKGLKSHVLQRANVDVSSTVNASMSLLWHTETYVANKNAFPEQEEHCLYLTSCIEHLKRALFVFT